MQQTWFKTLGWKVALSPSLLLEPVPQVLDLRGNAALSRASGSCVLLHTAPVVPQRGHVGSKQRAGDTQQRKGHRDREEFICRYFKRDSSLIPMSAEAPDIIVLEFRRRKEFHPMGANCLHTAHVASSKCLESNLTRNSDVTPGVSNQIGLLSLPDTTQALGMKWIEECSAFF